MVITKLSVGIIGVPFEGNLLFFDSTIYHSTFFKLKISEISEWYLDFVNYYYLSLKRVIIEKTKHNLITHFVILFIYWNIFSSLYP